MIFTIAIPTFNNASTIEATLESCVNQVFDAKFEVLVVNNNSTDNTENILSKYDDLIRTIKNNETVSMYENHNICLQKAQGDYVIFCHSDDQLLPDALKKYHDILKKRNFPEKYVLWGRSMFRDYFINWKRGGFCLNEISSGICCLDVLLWGGLTPSGTCYSLKSFLDLGGFLVGNHKLAPSDYVTSWKLALSHFEFEMSDRIFFIRNYSSTASGVTYKNKHINDSIIDMIQIFRKNMGDDSMRKIENRIINSDFFYIKLIYLLVKEGYINKRILRKKVLKYFLKRPLLLRNKEAAKLLFNII